uniref:Uncharacterized protein n=1 Tax=Arundo donax TaxID=35708 RepID=A0A0A8YAC6_ARUDO
MPCLVLTNFSITLTCAFVEGVKMYPSARCKVRFKGKSLVNRIAFSDDG